MSNTTKSFEVGRRYSCRSACDHECVWTFEVVKRTAVSVWIRQISNVEEPIERRKVSVYMGEETVRPFGRYSMAPILGAAKIVFEKVEA